MLNPKGRTLPDAVVILRDQAEECLLCQMDYIAACTKHPQVEFEIRIEQAWGSSLGIGQIM